jgi:hypothetical protein
MKKIFTLLVAFAAMTFAVNAQSLLSEGFDTDGMPSGWTSIDADGDGYDWMNSISTMGEGYGHNGSAGLMLSQSYNNNVGALTPDNWLVTPAVNLVGNSTLTFWVCGQDASWSAEHYGVYISTTSATDPTAFTQLMEATIGSKAQSPWEQKSVNLSAYTGQTVYIAFRHFDVTDMFYLDLDDVEISLGTGIADVNSEVSVYPIPAKTMVNVNANSNISNVEIYNIAGQKVSDFTANGTSATINTENLSNGMYLMRINTENGIINKKFSVAR